MTDEQIIKALEYCSTDIRENTCPKCAFYKKHRCSTLMLNAVSDLINRQKAEIKKLEKENEKQKAMLEAIDNEMMPLPFETDFDKAIKTAKSEAIKEFAERLSEKSEPDEDYRLWVPLTAIDSLVKQMTEGENNEREKAY